VNSGIVVDRNACIVVIADAFRGSRRRGVLQLAIATAVAVDFRLGDRVRRRVMPRLGQIELAVLISVAAVEAANDDRLNASGVGVRIGDLDAGQADVTGLVTSSV